MSLARLVATASGAAGPLASSKSAIAQTTAIKPIANGYPPVQCSSGMESKFMP